MRDSLGFQFPRVRRGLSRGPWDGEHRVQPYLIEVGVLSGCQPETLLVALESQQVGQQSGGDSDILAKVVVCVASHLPQPLSQLLGLHCVQGCLIQLQAIQLPGQRWAWSLSGPLSLSQKLHQKKGLARLKGNQEKSRRSRAGA